MRGRLGDCGGAGGGGQGEGRVDCKGLSREEESTGGKNGGGSLWKRVKDEA